LIVAGVRNVLSASEERTKQASDKLKWEFGNRRTSGWCGTCIRETDRVMFFEPATSRADESAEISSRE
jgi:hypothetical protein